MFRTMLRGQVVLDLVVAAAAAFVGALLSVGAGVGSGWLLALGFGAALALRRVAPGIGLLVACVVAVLQMTLLLQPDPNDLMIPVVVHGTSAYGTRRVRISGLVAAVLGALTASTYVIAIEYRSRIGIESARVLMGSEVEHGIELLAALLALLLLPWLAGLLARARTTTRMSREALLLAERDAARSDRAVAVEQERVRIAREMHDIVAHSLAVVIAQADGARYALRTAPEAAEPALTTIGTTARRALSDVRALLTTLRHEQGDVPTPTLDDVERLVEDMRAVGLDVTVARSGDPVLLSTASQLAAYRVVQEGLTNALKHGDHDAPVALTLAYAPEHVDIAVRNRLAPDRSPGPGTGHGLVGMRERAYLSGGTMTAGARGDQFTVAVRLPTTAGGAPAGADPAADPDPLTHVTPEAADA